jgi:ubiquinol-cytochrome c reductase cytochrome c1 subunit
MKNLMTRVMVILGLLAMAGSAAAAGAEVPIERWPAERARSLGSLQNGARLFANYCMGCHSANLVRWNRLQQIGLTDAQIKEFLIFGNQKVGDTMRIAMTPADAKAWFGKAPPDLSVITRARTSFEFAGTDYIYTMLRGYYRDNGTATGWNNVAYPSIAMPHVLWEQQGPREATIVQVGHTEKGYVRATSVYDAQGFVTTTSEPLSGHPKEGIEFSFKPVDPAKARKYDEDVADLVAFLSFMTDPSATTRIRIGVWVLVFLVIFTGVAYWLNGKFWRDVH